MVKECNVCGKEFKFISNLYQHQRTAKYCLKMAQELLCRYCNQVSKDPDHLEECIYYKNYKNYNLTVELKEANEKLESEVAALRQKCTDLEQKLDKEQKFKDSLLVKSASKPNKVSYNLNVVTHFPPEEEVRNIWEGIITPDLLKGGIKAFARAGHETFLMKDGQSTVVCVDQARHKFTYMGTDQIIQYDMKLQKITKHLFQPGADVTMEFLRELIAVGDEDEKLFQQAMSVGHIKNINSSSYKEFIRHLSQYISLSS